MKTQTHDDFTIGRIAPAEEWPESDSEELDALIINDTGTEQSAVAIQYLRSDPDRRRYLLPIFLYKASGDPHPAAEHLADGSFSDISNLEPLADRIREFRTRISELPARFADQQPSEPILTRALHWLYTRARTFEPVPWRRAKLGYLYPVLSGAIGFEKEEKLFEWLVRAEREGYVISEHQESLHLCGNCQNGLMHYRETCPECGSTEVELEDLIHHFSCAYVGPESDFLGKSDKGEKICPKCGKRLDHIGVDYDKPSHILNCYTCEHVFQEPQIRALCHHCGRDNKVEHLIRQQLKSYRLTELGREAIRDGSVDTARRSDQPEMWNFDLFKTLLGREIERLGIADLDSSLAALSIGNHQDMVNEAGRATAAQMMEELYEVIREELNPTIEMVFTSESLLLFLLPEKNVESARPIIDQVVDDAGQLLRDNLDGFEPEISWDLQQIHGNDSADAQVQSLIETVREG